jgi:hypothetical protein
VAEEIKVVRFAAKLENYNFAIAAQRSRLAVDSRYNYKPLFITSFYLILTSEK